METLISSTNEQQWTNTVTIEATEAVPNSLAEKGYFVQGYEGLCSRDEEAAWVRDGEGGC